MSEMTWIKVLANAARNFLIHLEAQQEFTHVATPDENAYIKAFHSILQRELTDGFEFSSFRKKSLWKKSRYRCVKKEPCPARMFADPSVFRTHNIAAGHFGSLMTGKNFQKERPNTSTAPGLAFHSEIYFNT
jgi:hypothetical protein